MEKPEFRKIKGRLMRKVICNSRVVRGKIQYTKPGKFFVFWVPAARAA